MKVHQHECPVRLQKSAPMFWGCPLHRKNFLVPAWSSGTEVILVGNIVKVLVVLVSLEFESLASQKQIKASNTPHYCQAFLCDRVLSFC